MNLKKQYQRLFEGRQAFAKANTLKTGDALLEFTPGDRFGGQDDDTMGSFDKNGDAVDNQQEGMDIEYWSDQLNTILESIDDFHQEIGTEVEMKSQETGNYQYDTMEKQISRYISGAAKQLESLQKYLERQKGKGL